MRGFSIVAKLLRDQRGATAIEYGLIAALIAIAAITAMGSLGNNSSAMWESVKTGIVKS